MNYDIIVLEPAKIFLDDLNVKMRAKSFRSIELLKEFGPFLREPHSKKVIGFDNLFELRVKFGSDIGRFFYFHDKDVIYVITSGYIKKDQKLKRSEIEKAVKLFKEYKGTNDEKN